MKELFPTFSRGLKGTWTWLILTPLDYVMFGGQKIFRYSKEELEAAIEERQRNGTLAIKLTADWHQGLSSTSDDTPNLIEESDLDRMLDAMSLAPIYVNEYSHLYCGKDDPLE